MILSLTDQRNKKVIVNLSNITHIVEHEITGIIIYFSSGEQLRVKEMLTDIEKKIRACTKN